MKTPFVTEQIDMVEVFKTNIRKKREARVITTTLTEQFPFHRINFDLQDCDKILRVEGHDLAPDQIIQTVQSQGFLCEVLS